MKSKTKILRETRTHYRLNPRSTGDEGCKYKEDSRKSAVGRCLSYNKIGTARLRTINDGKDVYFIDEKYGLNEVLKAEYKGHDIEFWADLQNFHDCDKFWEPGSSSKNRLTKVGRKAFNYLLSKHSA